MSKEKPVIEESSEQNDVIDEDSINITRLWLFVLTSVLIGLYIVYELSKAIIGFAMTISFRVLLPLIGIYFVMGLFKLDRILPRLSPLYVFDIHNRLMRAISKNENLHALVNNAFIKYGGIKSDIDENGIINTNYDKSNEYEYEYVYEDVEDVEYIDEIPKKRTSVKKNNRKTSKL